MNGIAGATLTWLSRPIPRGAIARWVYMHLWLGWLLAFWLGTVYTDIPNQIHWAYSFGLLAVGMVLLTSSSPLALLMHQTAWKVRGLLAVWGVIGLYLLAFYVVSFWELYPGTTVLWGKFEVIQLVVATNFYMLGRTCSFDELLGIFHRLGIVIVGLTIAQMALDPEAVRFGYGWQLMLCLPASVILRKYWFVAVALLVMLASKHKAALGCALLSVAIAFFFSHQPKRPENLTRYYLRWAVALVAFTAAVGVMVYLSPKIIETAGRFMPEGTTEFMGMPVEAEGVDWSRELVIEKSLDWLGQYLPQGMGYMNFSMLIGAETGLTSSGGRDDVEFIGINLHNSYMTWVLEGGILVTLAVLFMFWRVGKRIRAMWPMPATHNFAVLALAWSAADLLLGGFHQLHALMQLWGTVGLIFGFYDQTRFNRN